MRPDNCTMEPAPLPPVHTPGPWDFSMGYIVAPDKAGRHPDLYIAEIASEDDEDRIVSDPEQLANARLIVAAPDLLAFVKRMHLDLADGALSAETAREIHQEAASIIAKAEGRS